MPTISVRISENDKKRLMRYGSLSGSVRNALRMYLNAKKSEELLRKLGELQRVNHVRTSSTDEVQLINEDRAR